MRTMSESFLLVLLLCSAVSVSSMSMRYPDLGLVACRPHQLQSFTQFKNEFDTHHCNHSDDFNGIWCDNVTGVVTKLQLRTCLSGTLKPNSSLFMFHQLRYLDLNQNNFTSSSLPSEFGKLNRLEVLSLFSNGFIGPVPSSFSNLSLLSILDLSSNKLTGSFQFVRSLSKLTVLRLSQNHFSGTLDPNHSLFKLHHLTYLDLSENNFTSSSIPYEIGNLNELEVLCLSFNSFLGPVPPTISNLTFLSELYLDTNELSGTFPPVQNLTSLVTLKLFDNQFCGTIPSSLFTMPFLSYLELWGNDFNGTFEVSSSSRLKRLYLGHNHFDEKILEPISKLTNIKELDISFLNTSYPIDLSLFSSFKSLLLLDLSGVRISEASLSETFIPPTLEALRLKQCNISSFPNIIKTLENLVHISLSKNIIGGKVPEWIWSLPRLNSVFIDGNFLYGFEGSPEVLVNSSVQILFMHSNRFEGALPHLPLSINFFNAQANNFTGNIPLSICNRSSLTVLDLSYNNLTGPLPPCLSNLFFLNLRKNKLEGNIPDKFYVDAPLRSFDVGYNRLTGKLPRSLLNCSSLQFISADYNKIEDRFPFWLKALPNLQVLLLSSNKLYGHVSSQNGGPLGFPELRILEIAGNKLTGSLPPNFFVNWKASSARMNEEVGQYMVYKKVIYGTYYLTYRDSVDLPYKGLFPMEEKILTSYATIDMSGNSLEGQIPESIGLLKAVIAITLSNNAFTGHIPLSMANLVKLESLDLSGNQLSGTIPKGLGSLSFLAYINVSHNQLTGEIPHGTQIAGQPISCFEGNPGLCGFPLEESCFGTPPAKEGEEGEEEEEEEEHVLNWKAVAISYVPGVLLGLLIAQLIVLYKPEWIVKIVGQRIFFRFWV